MIRIPPGIHHWINALRRRDGRARMALLLGISLGAGVGGLFIPGGLDAWDVFFTDRIQTVLPWVHVLLKPAAVLGWPYSYAVLCALSTFATAFVADRMNAPLWLVLLSAPFTWELWSGQVDWLGVLGIYLAIYILENNRHPFWLGLAWVLIATKPWGFGFLVITVVLALRQYGFRRLVPAALVPALVWMLPWLLWPPDTLGKLLSLIYTNGQSLSSDGWNGAIWPWGLLAWISLLGCSDRRALLRRAVAASLLSTTYLRLYHVVALVVLVDNAAQAVVLLVVGWGTVLSAFVGLPWRTLAWVVPVLYLALEQLQTFITRYLRPIPTSKTTAQ